METFEEVHE